MNASTTILTCRLCQSSGPRSQESAYWTCGRCGWRFRVNPDGTTSHWLPSGRPGRAAKRRRMRAQRPHTRGLGNRTAVVTTLNLPGRRLSDIIGRFRVWRGRPPCEGGLRGPGREGQGYGGGARTSELTIKGSAAILTTSAGKARSLNGDTPRQFEGRRELQLSPRKTLLTDTDRFHGRRSRTTDGVTQ